MLYSQAGQDQFVLNMLNNKKYGTYLEIGAYHSQEISNTYALEKDYFWWGIGIEIDQSRVMEYNLNRVNKCIMADAMAINYKTLFEQTHMPKQIDYLQVDIEPAQNTLAALKALPLDEYRFSVITFEHDLYANKENINIKNEQQDILLSYGYQLVKDNVTCNHPDLPFEDWWIDPKVISYPQSYPQINLTDYIIE